MNKRDLSLYLRDRTWDGSTLEPLIGGLAEVKERYPNPQKDPANSLLNAEHAPYLMPSSSNRLLLIRPKPGALERILDIYLAHTLDSVPTVTAPLESDVRSAEIARRGPRILSADELVAQLDRNAATGRAGEAIALADELVRLRDCGCPDAETHVELVAQSDVGRGYDIASTWPSEQRCIEVKTTTAEGSDFFITENERQVLAGLGSKAWLYRVVLNQDGSGSITSRIQDPIRQLPENAFRPVVWRVDAALVQ
jgi:hypothetical protein